MSKFADHAVHNAAALGARRAGLQQGRSKRLGNETWWTTLATAYGGCTLTLIGLLQQLALFCDSSLLKRCPAATLRKCFPVNCCLHVLPGATVRG
jgi:hypothetical protein